jgi:hypothetical protein
MTDYESATEIREALVAAAEQLEGLNTLATRIATALEIIAVQTHAAHRAELGSTYDTILAEEIAAAE